MALWFLKRPLVNLRIRNRLLLACPPVFLLMVLAGSGFLYLHVRETVKENVAARLRHATRTTVHVVGAEALQAVRGHLRDISRRCVEIARTLEGRAEAGVLAEREARRLAKEAMLREPVGKSGYIFCLNSKGEVVFHPLPDPYAAFSPPPDLVGEITRKKDGWFEYHVTEKKTGRIRNKAMYMARFLPWDWIICVTVDRAEFSSLALKEEFQRNFPPLSLEDGFSFVLDEWGGLVDLPGNTPPFINIKDPDMDAFTREIRSRKAGETLYWTGLRGHDAPVHMWAVYNTIPEFGWTVVSSCEWRTITAPVRGVLLLFGAWLMVMALVCVLVSLVIGNSITRQARALRDRFEQGARGDCPVRAPNPPGDEPGELAALFNTFMCNLEEAERQRAKAVRELQESERSHRLLAENMTDVVWILDGRLVIRYVSPSVARQLGYTSGEITGRDIAELFRPEEFRELVRLVSGTLDSKNPVAAPGQTVTTELETLRADGTWVSTEAVIGFFRDEDNSITGILAVSRDISGRKRAERALRESEEKLRRLSELLPETVCDGAPTGAAALELLEQARHGERPCHAVIVDHKTPEKGGEAFVQAARGLAPPGETAFLMRRSAVRKMDHGSLEKAGVSACLAKPARLSLLVPAPRSALSAANEEGAGRILVPGPADGETGSRGDAFWDASVLLVEDSPTNQIVALSALEKLGCAADVAENGEEALARLRSKRYDIVFMDCQMPAMDGFEATRRIRAMEGPAGRTPVVAMTANAMAGDKERCIEAGMDDYIAKPVRQRSLLAVLGRFFPKAGAKPRLPYAKALIALAGRGLEQAALDAVSRAFPGTQVRTAGSGVEALTLLGGVLPDLFILDPALEDIDAVSLVRHLRGEARFSNTLCIAATGLSPDHFKVKALAAELATGVVHGEEELRGRIFGLAGIVAGAREAREEPVFVQQQPVQEGEEPVVFDPESVRGAVGDDPATVREYLEIFLADMPAQIERLQEAHAREDVSGLARLAHRVKGAAADVGGKRLQAAALELEKAAAHQARETLPGLVTAVAREYEALAQALRAYKA
jgi:PAS domain S-box-containing protein